MDLRQLQVRSPWVIDVALAVLMLALGLAEVVSVDLPKVGADEQAYREQDWRSVVAVVLQSAPLLARRFAPVPGIAVNVAVLWVMRDWGYAQLQIDAPVMLLLFYAAGAFQARRPWVVGAVVVAAPIVAFTSNQPDNATGVNIFGLSTVFLVAYVVGRVVDRYRHEAVTQRELARRAEAEREQQIQQAVAEERSHIARELHDVVAHSLGFIALEAEAGRAVFDRDPARARDALETVGTAGRQGLSEMRRLLAVLREHDTMDSGVPQAPQPTLADLPALMQSVRAAGLPVELDLDVGRHAALPPGVQLSAYRIVQEALTNALKHAGAATAHVAVRHLDDQVFVEVVDTGNPATVPYPRPRENDGHVPHGLIGMRERATLYGGELHAGPLPGAGWRVAAALPLGDTAPQEVPA